MKKLITAITSLLFITSNAQVVMTNNFSEWSGGNVVGWNGNSSHTTDLTITQITEGAVFGTSAVQLATTGTTHRRFSSDPTPIEGGTEYQFTYYAKGRGDIRIGVLDEGEESFGFWYSAYFVLNSEDWIEINQSVVAAASTPTGQFIFSVRNTFGANGHIQIDSVSVSSATVPLLSIYDIQFTESPTGDSDYLGESVLTGGIVTGVKANPNGGYFLQSGSGTWSGVFVFDPSNNTNVAIGDSITLGGLVEERFNNTQITSVTGFTKVSSGNPVPEPLVVTTSTIATEPYEGVMVSTVEANCTAAPNNFGVWSINDGSGLLNVAPDLYTHSPVVVNTKYNVTGVVLFTFSEFRLLPRNAGDVSIFVGINDNNILQFELYPNPAQDFLNIQLRETANNVLIEISDLSGKLVRSQQFNSTQLMQVETADLSKGMYLVRISNGLNSSSKLVSIQ
jgi:hypothetical protein